MSRRHEYDSGASSKEVFIPLSNEVLFEIEKRDAEEEAKRKIPGSEAPETRSEDNESMDELQEDPFFVVGRTLPNSIEFPASLAGKPLKEIDLFYEFKETFVVINRHRQIYRFSRAKTIWLMNSLHIVRRFAIRVITHPIFILLMNLIIIANCFMLIFKENATIEKFKRIFILLYTIEFILYVAAKGFVLHPFSYLRDPWHWFDVIVLISDYVYCFPLSKKIYLGSLRAIRLLRLMGTTTVPRGVRSFIEQLHYSVLNLRDAFIVALYLLAIFALIGLHAYMGILTRKCISDLPDEARSNMTDVEIEEFYNVSTYWYFESSNNRDPKICGYRNNSGQCPSTYTCLEGYGSNPNHGYTSFDNYIWSLLSTFRVIALDHWECLLKMIIRAAGPWHIWFFIGIIFLVRNILYNMFLTVLILSFEEITMRQQLEDEEEQDDQNAVKEEKALVEENSKSVKSSLETTLSSTNLVFESDGKIKRKRKMVPSLKNTFVNLLKHFCIWECCSCCKTFHKHLKSVVYSVYIELFLIICVIVSTIILAINHFPMDPELDEFVKKGTRVFAVIFAVEVVVKLLAESPYNYFKELRHIYEFVVLLLTIPVLLVDNVACLLVLTKILTILRAFRLIRVFRLEKVCRRLRWFVAVLKNCLLPFGILIVYFFIIAFIFAVMGVQFFGKMNKESISKYFSGEVPRWNFTDFTHSIMLVFRAICGEWIESMWDFMLLSGWRCAPYFVSLAILSNFLVSTIFFVVVYNETVKSRPKEVVQENDNLNIFRCSCLVSCIFKRKRSVVAGTLSIDDMTLLAASNTRASLPSVENALEERVNSCTVKAEGVITVMSSDITDVKPIPKNDAALRNKEYIPDYNSVRRASGSKTSYSEQDVFEKQSAAGFEPCCPMFCYRLPSCFNSSVWRPWNALRSLSVTVIESGIFNLLMVLCAIIGIVALAMDDKKLKDSPKLELAVKYVLLAVEILFFLEMLTAWLGRGFKAYFTNGWCWLNFLIIVMSLTTYIASAIYCRPVLKAFQAFRPLRLVARIQGPKLVTIVFLASLPNILGCLFFCLSIWLVFAIIGVTLFEGKFSYCTNENGNVIYPFQTINKTDCLLQNYTWNNDVINFDSFDNVGSSLLTLFQVATFKGWIVIIHTAVDSPHEKYHEENNLNVLFYFVIFIIVGCYFTFNLFASVVISDHLAEKKNLMTCDGLEMSATQRNYENALNDLRYISPSPPIPTFKCKLQFIAYKIISDRWFDLAITICFTLNLMVKAFEYYGMNKNAATSLTVLNIFFILIYVGECLVKMLGLCLNYFKNPWNVFDLVVVILAVIELILPDIMAKYLMTEPILLRLLKVLIYCKIRKLFRWSRWLVGIRAMSFGFFASLPSIFCVVFLQFLVMCVYAFFGMCVFQNVKYGGGLDEMLNFSTFGKAMIILFQLSTTAGWDQVLLTLMNENNCTHPSPDWLDKGDCGDMILAIIYVVSYLVIMFLIIVKLYTAIILQFYSDITEQIQEGLTYDDYESFYDTWRKYDPSGTGFINYEDLSNLVDEVELPLGMSKPNKYKLVSMDIPIYEGHIVHAHDIINALVKDFFFRKQFEEDTLDGLLDDPEPERSGKKLVSSTVWNQREQYSACVIQRTWNSYRSGKSGRTFPVAPMPSGNEASGSKEEESKPTEPADGT